MPKIVDPEERREQIAAAVRRVIERDGTAAASVRTVAQEANLSVGSLRHYFSTHDEMLRFTASSMWDDVHRRISDRLAEADDVAGIVDALIETLPTDAASHAEFAVWLDLVSTAHPSSPLHDLSASTHADLHRLCLCIVRHVSRRRAASTHRLAACRLHALLDGLGLHLSLYPDQVDADDARAALTAELNAICTS